MDKLYSALVGLTITVTLIVLQEDSYRTSQREKYSQTAVNSKTIALDKPEKKREPSENSDKKQLAAKDKKLSEVESEVGGIEEALKDIRQENTEKIEQIRDLPLSGNKNFWLSPPLKRFKIVSGFGVRISPFTGRVSFHKGLDLGARYGSPIFAAARGKVSKSGWISNTCGLGAVIYHGQKRATIYCHMSLVFVRRGERVRRGELIGLVGTTGRSTGPHLHFSVKINKRYRNPLDYLNIRKNNLSNSNK